MTLKKLQNIAEKLVKIYCGKYNIEPYNIKVKNLKTRGRIRFETRYISIPIATYEQGGIHYFIAYVIHEIAHLIRYHVYYDDNHGKEFRSLEKKLLQKYNLVPLEYGTSYYHRLENTKGKTLWLG